MKNVLLVGGSMLGLGIAIGWVIKPAPASISSGTTSEASPSKSLVSPATASVPEVSASAIRPQREPAVKKPSNMPTEEQMSQGKKMQADMTKGMVKRQRTKLEQQILRLEEKIQLTTEQKSGITTWLDDQLKKMESMDFTDPSAMGNVSEVAGSITTEALENQLANSLTVDQKTALEDFRENELHLKVDAMALKSLSKLQGVIEFEDGQRDEVYKVLTKNAESAVLAESKTPDLSKMLTEGMGIEIDPYDLGLQEVMTDLQKEKGVIPGEAKHSKLMRESFEKRVDQKINQLKGVLNDRQLARYREELMSKGMGVFGTLMTEGGLEISTTKAPATSPK